jgi:uncharacterized membrane protein
MVLATVNSGAYKVFFLLHILSIVIGFGGVIWNGLYGAQSKKLGGAEGAAISEANFLAASRAEWVIYSVPIWGFAMIGLSDKYYKFSQAWIGISLLLYIVAAVVARVVLVPSHRQYSELIRSGGAITERDALYKKMAAVGGTLNLVLVVITILMIWKPGV